MGSQVLEYQTYLASREWALKKRAVRERSGGICERCHLAPHQQTHHLTYERIGQEELEDLQGLCNACHEFVSGKSDVDPADELQTLRQWMFEAYENDPALAFRHLERNLVHTLQHIDHFNLLIQVFILEQEHAHPETALRLADIKLRANKRFYEEARRLA